MPQIKYYIKYLKQLTDQVLLFGTFNELRAKITTLHTKHQNLNQMSVNDIVLWVTTHGTMTDLGILDGYHVHEFNHGGVIIYSAHTATEIRFIVGL